MKRILIFLALLIGLAIIGAYAYTKGKRYDVVITQNQINTVLAKKFPVEKSFFFIFKITYSNPQVTLLPNSNRVQVSLDALLNFKINDQPKDLGGSCTLTSGIDYRYEEKAFYLSEVQFERLEIQGVPKKYLKLVTLIASELARDELENYPIYRLKKSDPASTAAKLLLRKVEVKNQELATR